MKHLRQKGFTIMEIMLAITVAIVIFQLVFYLYLSVFRSWDFGFARSKVEDTAYRVVRRLSKELRNAEEVSVDPANFSIQYTLNNQKRALYFYAEENSYARFKLGLFVPTAAVSLKQVDAEEITADNYGEGVIIAGEIKPPGFSQFSKSSYGLVKMRVVVAAVQNSITLNSSVLPRN